MATVFYSKLSNSQRAVLATNAQWHKDTIACGKVTRRGDPKTATALVSRTAREVERDVDYARKRANVAAMQTILAETTDIKVRKCEPGKARNANFLNRKRGGVAPRGLWGAI